MIAHLLGAPREDFHLWAAWSDEVVQGTWPALNRNERGVGLPGAHPEFSDYVDALIASAPRRPARRLHHPAAAEPRSTAVTSPTSRRARSSCSCSSPGNETTRHLIGNLLWTVAQDPELLRAACRADRELVPTAVEESLRHDPPIRFLLRNCMQDHDLHGEHLAPRRQGGVRDPVGEPRRGGVRGSRTRSASTGPTRVATSPSAAGRTCARAPAWPGSKARVALGVFLDRVAEVQARRPRAPTTRSR